MWKCTITDKYDNSALRSATEIQMQSNKYQTGYEGNKPLHKPPTDIRLAMGLVQLHA